MSELKEFVKKRTAEFSGISCRKLYGLEAFYLGDMPFIVISSNEQVVVKVDDFEVKNTILKIPHVSQWVLDDKVMDNWFTLPDTFNKKKNKLSPIFEMTSKALLNPKKEKKIRKKKSKTQKTSSKIKLKKAPINKTEPSFFKRLIKFFN